MCRLNFSQTTIIPDFLLSKSKKDIYELQLKLQNKKKRNSIKNILSTVTVIFILSFCLIMPSCLNSSANKHLSIGIMPDIDSIPFAVAMQKGFLPENITITLYKSAVERDSALFSGNIDGCISDMLAAYLASESGFAVYTATKTNGIYGLLSYSKSSVMDLEGKSIGLSLNTVIEYATDKIFAQSGADIKKTVKLSVPKIPSRLELLLTGSIDAICVPEPYVTAAVNEGAYLIKTSDELGINPGIVLFTENAAQNKKEMIEILKQSYDMAVAYINNNNNDDFMPEVIEFMGFPESAAATVLPEYDKWSLPDKSELEAAAEWLKGKNLIKGNKYTNSVLIHFR